MGRSGAFEGGTDLPTRALVGVRASVEVRNFFRDVSTTEESGARGLRTKTSSMIQGRPCSGPHVCDDLKAGGATLVRRRELAKASLGESPVNGNDHDLDHTLRERPGRVLNDSTPTQSIMEVIQCCLAPGD